MNDRRPPAGNRWPAFILLLALCFLSLSAWSVYRAGSEVSPPLSDRQPGYASPRLPAHD